MTGKEYTHIIIGSGSAGCVVGARIAENEATNVLLIEAGPDPHEALSSPMSKAVGDARRVPMRGQTPFYDPTIDWAVELELSDGDRMAVPQAKLVGGGSAINGGTALRNSRADCVEWQKLGNTTWTFDSMSDIYSSLENDAVNGRSGPHPLARATDEGLGKIQRAFIAGAQESGFDYSFDQNEDDAEGVSPSPVCRRGNQRISLSNSFLDPIRDTSNVTIMHSSLVDRIFFDNSAPPRAKGVVMGDGRKIHASVEVVLCAGAIFSPAILQRSGIGPAILLRPLGIPVVADLPNVGLHLQDHPCVPLISRPLPGSYSENDFSLQCNARWSSAGRPGAIDLQLVCFSYLYVDVSKSSGNSKQRSLGGIGLDGHVAGIGCNINKPTSTGSVNISSTKPDEQPVVRPNYLTTTHDRQLAREAVRKGYSVLTSPSMRAVLELPAAVNENIVASDDLLDHYINKQYTSTYHFTSTCRMASQENGGVVDQSGRVYTVQNLRVADASVLPTAPAANTMWTTVMFAERIGRSIRDDKKGIAGVS